MEAVSCKCTAPRLCNIIIEACGHACVTHASMYFMAARLAARLYLSLDEPLNRSFDGKANGDALLLREMTHRLIRALLAVVAAGEAVDIALALGGVVDKFAAPAQRQVVLFVLDAERDASVAAQIALFDPANFCVHCNRTILFKQIPHCALLRGPIGIERGEDGKTPLVQESPGTFG